MNAVSKLCTVSFSGDTNTHIVHKDGIRKCFRQFLGVLREAFKVV
jgi:hypothetical protein